MQEILAAFAAAGLSFLINTIAFNRWGDRAITYLSPIVEEMAKTMSAYGFGAQIFVVHAIFGLIEGVSDMSRLRPFIGLVSAAAGIISHAVFGYITVAVFEASGRLVAGVTGAWTVHTFWNVFVLYYAEKRKRL